MKGEFFVESAFGEVYEKTFLEDDIRESNIKAKQFNNNKEPERFLAADNPVRMFNQVDVDRESAQAINSNYRLGGDFSANFSNHFCGKIFCDI